MTRVVDLARPLAVALTVLALATGCADATSGLTQQAHSTTATAPSQSAPSAPQGSGVPVLLRVKDGVAEAGFAAALISGTLSQDDRGCLRVDDVLLVLPSTATWSGDAL